MDLERIKQNFRIRSGRSRKSKKHHKPNVAPVPSRDSPHTSDPTSNSNFTFVASQLGCSNSSELVDCMRNVSAVNITNFVGRYTDNRTLVSDDASKPPILFAPVADEKIVFSNYTARYLMGDYANVPTIYSTCAMEGEALVPYPSDPTTTAPNQTLAEGVTLEAFLCPAALSSQLREQVNATTPTYRYVFAGNFSNVSPLFWMGAYHASDLAMNFGTYQDLTNPELSASSMQQEAEVSQAMQDRILSFAASKGLSVGDWPTYQQGSVLVFGNGTEVVQTDSCEYSDLKLICHDKIFHVHKAIVCPRSKWFQTVCKPEWGKDDQSKKELDLNDEDPMIVGLMVDHFYQMEYDDALPSWRAAEIRNQATQTAAQSTPTQARAVHGSGYNNGDHRDFGQTAAFANHEPQDGWGMLSERSTSTKKKSKKTLWLEPEPELKPKPLQEISYHNIGDDSNLDAESLSVNALMYALADKYEIENLKSLAIANFENAARGNFSAAVFSHAAHLVFTTTPSCDTSLRNIVVKTISQHRRLIDYEGIASLIKSGNEIGWALIQMLK